MKEGSLKGLVACYFQEAFPTASSFSPSPLDLVERKPGRFKRAACWEVTGEGMELKVRTSKEDL